MEKFEEYFQKADVDRDGRISGDEAVTFLQGSNLHRQVLAQIWMHADQNRTGFLSRPEFYNALKLVTVAQSKRELTPDIVKAALYGPASAKIPAPQITVSAIPGPQPSPEAAPPLAQVAVTSQPSSQNPGLRGPSPPTASINQQSGTVLSTSGMNQQLRPLTSSNGMNQQFGMVPSSSGVNQQLIQAQPTSTMHQQFEQVPRTNTSMNRPFAQIQPSSTGMNQQYGQVPPTSASMNRQFGQLQPSSTGINQQYGQVTPSTNTNAQFFPAQGNQIRPAVSLPTGPASRPPQAAIGLSVSGSMTGFGLPNSNNAWSVGNNVASSIGPATQVMDRGANPSISSVAPNLHGPSYPEAKDSKAVVSSGIGPHSDAMFSGDLFSTNQYSSQKVSSAPQQPTGSLPTPSSAIPVTSSAQPSAKPDPFEALQSTLRKPSAAIPAAQVQYAPKSNQQTPSQVTSSILTPVVQTGMENSMSEPSQISWPKMTRAGIQKYVKVFMEVDTDRDGQITGDQARNLFLSWRLPREVLKQIWDLSDQDSDSMLSLREFCIALYLMERYREGNPLPSVLPNSVMADETLLTLAGPPTAYGSMGWSPAAGLNRQQALPGAQPVPHAGGRLPLQPVVSQADRTMQFNQKNAGGHTIDNSHANQHSNGQVNYFDIGGQEAAETTEKVDNKENVLLDSREKLEYYRTKMQDLVLYKSRCDNRLNEITERARADKGEAESLEKKYQEKYKQVAEIHSKLTIEEASFREIQERKMELQQAITKMEQGGSADGILQVRADRIQSDLEELLKALTERCKKHSAEVKSSALIELPPGWQPGIPEIAAMWDEDWDKFEDEGFSFDVAVPENGKSPSVQREISSPTHSYSPDSPSNASTPQKPFAVGASAFDADSVFSADESKSPQGSPERPTTCGSPSKEYTDDHFRKSFDGESETHRGFDEPSWGDFDNNDDIDSVWGFNTKDPDNAKNEEKYLFGSNNFSASPERSSSPHPENAFPKSNLFFEESVPSTPLSMAGNESRGPFGDSFSRYDSFSTHDQASSPRRDTFTRFDSINSSRGFDHSSSYSFDDSDPFGSSGPFKVSSETSKEKF